MKQHWDNLTEAIQKLIDDDAVVINGLRHGKGIAQIKKTFEKNLKNLLDAQERFETFVADPEAQTVELPFTGEEFAQAWADYKEMLLGVHNIVLLPVEERRRLTKLYRLSSKNEKTASDILDFYINCRYQRLLFRPTDEQLYGETPEAEETGFTIKKNTI